MHLVRYESGASQRDARIPRPSFSVTEPSVSTWWRIGKRGPWLIVSEAANQMETGVDVRERGANQQLSDRRLFMQLQVFTGADADKPLVAALESSRIDAVLYADVNDPRGVAVLAFAEDPSFLATGLRIVLG